MEKKKSVLIIDDDELLLDMYSVKLRELGFKVEIASGGLDAIEKLRGGFSSDAILLDIVMPDMDGFDFLKTIKDENLMKGGKIIILTNLGQKENVKKGIELGAHDYIIKASFTPSEVAEKIKNIINK